MAGSTRQQILAELKRNGSMTVAQLSKALGITAVGVRQHLVGLERDGHVRATPVRQKIGRPVHVYRLTDAAAELFPSDYEALLVGILDQVRKVEGPDKIVQLLSARAEWYQAAHEASVAAPELAERVRRLCEIRDGQGFYAECRTENDGTFRLVEHHCPIHAVAKDYPEACESEREMFEKLLGAQVTRESAVAAGEQQCCFRIQTPQRGAGAG